MPEAGRPPPIATCLSEIELFTDDGDDGEARKGERNDAPTIAQRYVWGAFKGGGIAPLGRVKPGSRSPWLPAKRAVALGDAS